MPANVLLLDEPDQSLQRLNENIIPYAKVAQGAAAAALDFGRLDDNQARATGRELAGVHQMPVGRESLDRRILVHRRHHNTVAQLDAPDRKRREQQHLGHGLFPRTRAGGIFERAKIYALDCEGKAAIGDGSQPGRRTPHALSEGAGHDTRTANEQQPSIPRRTR